MASILVVEDEHLTRVDIATALQFVGYQTIEVQEGRDALGMLARARGQIAAVVIDIQLSQIHGLRLFAQIIDRYPAMPIIVVIAHVMHAVEAKAHFLRKPFNRRQLIDVVHQATQQGAAV
jgi:DNA-binding NtrC family response regulator